MTLVGGGGILKGLGTAAASVFLPMLLPAKAAAAPHKCTTPEPAKSEKPAASKKPPPHFQ